MSPFSLQGVSLLSAPAQHIKCVTNIPAHPMQRLLQCIHHFPSCRTPFSRFDCELQVPMMGGVPGGLPGYQQAQQAPLQSMQRFHSQQLPPSRGPHHIQRQHSGMGPAGDHHPWLIGVVVHHYLFTMLSCADPPDCKHCLGADTCCCYCCVCWCSKP